jgi:hypothetical protein
VLIFHKTPDQVSPRLIPGPRSRLSERYRWLHEDLSGLYSEKAPLLEDRLSSRAYSLVPSRLEILRRFRGYAGSNLARGMRDKMQRE